MLKPRIYIEYDFVLGTSRGKIVTLLSSVKINGFEIFKVNTLLHVLTNSMLHFKT